jgi:hypothetical protein
MHDFAITEHYVVWLDLPVVFDPAEHSGIPYRWNDSYPARIGVMRRDFPAARVQWFAIEPAYILHVTIVKYDSRGGGRTVAAMGLDRMPSEAVFVPAAGGTRENDGYLRAVPRTGSTARTSGRPPKACWCAWPESWDGEPVRADLVNMEAALHGAGQRSCRTHRDGRWCPRPPAWWRESPSLQVQLR